MTQSILHPADSPVHADHCEKRQSIGRGRDPSSCRHRSLECCNTADSPWTVATFHFLQIQSFGSAGTVNTWHCHPQQRRRAVFLLHTGTQRPPHTRGDRADSWRTRTTAATAAANRWLVQWDFYIIALGTNDRFLINLPFCHNTSSKWGNQGAAGGETEGVQGCSAEGQEAGRCGASSTLLKDQQGLFLKTEVWVKLKPQGCFVGISCRC